MGVCAPWFDPADLDCVPSGSAGPDQAAAEAALVATDLLYVWSGRQFAGAGACQSTARPGSRRRHGLGYGYGSSWAWGAWDGYFWGGFGCGCRHSDRVVLPGYPITAVDSVVIDGAAVDPAAYRLESRRELVRQDGGRWPACQNDDAPLGAVGTWSVTYRHGAGPPEAGVAAAKRLACELLSAAAGKKCALPNGVTKVVRQGVTYDRIQTAFGEDGKVVTGIAAVDAFLGTYNPAGLRRRVMIVNPDRPHARRI